jgi:hypothetical protein
MFKQSTNIHSFFPQILDLEIKINIKLLTSNKLMIEFLEEKLFRDIFSLFNQIFIYEKNKDKLTNKNKKAK